MLKNKGQKRLFPKIRWNRERCHPNANQNIKEWEFSSKTMKSGVNCYALSNFPIWLGMTNNLLTDE